MTKGEGMFLGVMAVLASSVVMGGMLYLILEWFMS